MNPLIGFKRATAFWLGACLLALLTLPASAQTVQLINLIRPSATDFYVGETWTLNVFGPPNQSVSITATHNGIPLGTTPLGTTDSTGFFTLSGSMSVAEIGNWVETVFVGGVAATPTLVFSVLGAPVDPCGPVSVSPNPLTLFSIDYYTFGSYSHSDFAFGIQSGAGQAPNCGVATVIWGAQDEHLGVTSISFPSAWLAQVRWEDLGGRIFASHPALVNGFTIYVGLDFRNGIPFVGIGETSLLVFRVDF